jgi:hypothetical protein
VAVLFVLDRAAPPRAADPRPAPDATGRDGTATSLGAGWLCGRSALFVANSAFIVPADSFKTGE